MFYRNHVLSEVGIIRNWYIKTYSKMTQQIQKDKQKDLSIILWLPKGSRYSIKPLTKIISNIFNDILS